MDTKAIIQAINKELHNPIPMFRLATRIAADIDTHGLAISYRALVRAMNTTLDFDEFMTIFSVAAAYGANAAMTVEESNEKAEA